MATKKQVTGEIIGIERLTNSVNGNPRYRISVFINRDGITDVRTLTTSSDISDAYEVHNPGYREGCRVEFTLTPAGKVATMRTLESVA